MLKYQPCFSAFLNETNIQRCILPDTPDRDRLVAYLIAQSQRMANSKYHTCIFSHKGLTDFATHGYIGDFPVSGSVCLGIADRLQMLRKLYYHCKYDTMFLRLANPVIFPFPEDLCITIEDEVCLTFSSPSLQPTPWKQMQTTERTLLEAFDDFYVYLMDSQLIYSKEETLREVDSFINLLSQKINTTHIS